MRRILFLSYATAAVLGAQTTINGSRTITGSWDASGASATKPAKTGSALPSNCSTGEFFFFTGVAGGQNLYLCLPDNTWNQVSGTGTGSGGGSGSGPVTDTYSMFFQSDANGTVSIPNVQLTGLSAYDKQNAWAAVVLPQAGNPYTVITRQLSPTQTGNVGLTLYTINTQGATGVNIGFNISHYCASGNGSSATPAFTNVQTLSFSVLGGGVFSANSIPAVNLTGCSPGSLMFIKVARDSTSAYPYPYELVGLVLTESHN